MFTLWRESEHAKRLFRRAGVQFESGKGAREMVTVVAYHPGDADQALRQASWIAELDGGLEKRHELILIADTRCPEAVTAQITLEYAKSFAAVELIPFVDHYRKWPNSPNEVFALAARHVASSRKQPWLFLEPDAIPLKRGWLDDIAAEYQRALKGGKHFLGDLVTAGNSGVNVVTHMSGNAVWPANLYEHCGQVFLAGNLAFDVAAASEIVPQMAVSSLILHRWKSPAFGSWEEVELRLFALKPGAVLFHSDKTGSLIPLLREKLNLPVPVLAEEAIAEANGPEARESTKPTADDGSRRAHTTYDGPMTPTNSRGGQFICDIFVKSYKKDAPWLEYCLRSIETFSSGFNGCVIIWPLTSGGAPLGALANNLRKTVLFQEEYGPNGYLSQQVFKLYADEFTAAEFICYIDSDTIFTRPVSPEMFFTGEKINWLISPHSTVDTPWQHGAEKFLKQPVEFEFMRRFCLTVPRWLLQEVRYFCQKHHGVSMSEYVMAQEPPNPAFSEFNILGAYAYAFYQERFNWIDTSQVPESEWPPLVVLQSYSHDGLSAEKIAEFETILSGGTEGCAKVSEGLGSTPDSPPDTAEARPGKSHSENQASPAQELSTATDLDSSGHGLIPFEVIPWANREESIAEIKRMGARLKAFQGNNPVKVRFVRELLQRQGVIVLPYRNRKRKGWKRKKQKGTK